MATWAHPNAFADPSSCFQVVWNVPQMRRTDHVSPPSRNQARKIAAVAATDGKNPPMTAPSSVCTTEAAFVTTIRTRTRANRS
jgi:hypothetical protein